MNKHFNTTTETLRSVRLSAEKKAAMRERLLAYSDMHPVVPAASPLRLVSYFSMHRAIAASFIVVLIVGTGGGGALAAEGAVPGEVLYAVKINLNEKVAEALATTPAARAELSAHLTTERLNEAVVLAEKGELDDSTSDYLLAEVNTHTDQSVKEAQLLDAQGETGAADKVRSKLDDDLARQSILLAKAAERLNDDKKGSAERLLAKLDEKRFVIARARARADGIFGIVPQGPSAAKHGPATAAKQGPAAATLMMTAPVLERGAATSSPEDSDEQDDEDSFEEDDEHNFELESRDPVFELTDPTQLDFLK